MMKKSITSVPRPVVAAIRPFSTRYRSSPNPPTTITPVSLSPMEVGMKYGLSALMIPVAPLFFFSVPNNKKAVLTNYGKYSETVPEGLYWRAPVGLARIDVFVGTDSQVLKKSRIVDSNGNPVIVSGTVNFTISDPAKFVVNVGHDDQYLINQAEIILKRVTSEYPYESPTADSLTKGGAEISERMTQELQRAVDVAGIHVIDFFLTDINYAPEIATHMLIRQRALAYVDAKDTIAKASVDIVHQILEDIKTKCGVTLSEERKGAIIDHLLVVMTSESGVQPVLSLEHGGAPDAGSEILKSVTRSMHEFEKKIAQIKD